MPLAKARVKLLSLLIKALKVPRPTLIVDLISILVITVKCAFCICALWEPNNRKWLALNHCIHEKDDINAVTALVARLK